MTDTEGYKETDILIFSKTVGYRHKSIRPAVEMVTNEAKIRGWSTLVTNDGAFINSGILADVKVVVFLNTAGNILDDRQKEAFENYIESGGGYVGIHSAADTEHHWPWYNRLLGTHFKSHTLIPMHTPYAEIITEDNTHPSTRHLPALWLKKDEWYNFRQNVREIAGIKVLLSLNERTYSSIWPKKMDGDHPICWTNQLGSGRMFYTAIGHTSQTFSDKICVDHIIGGIQWAGRL